MDDVTALMTVMIEVNVPTCRSITLAMFSFYNPADVGGLVHFQVSLHPSTISSTTSPPTLRSNMLHSFFWLPLSGSASKKPVGDDAFKNIISVVIFPFVCSVGLIMLDAT